MDVQKKFLHCVKRRDLVQLMSMFLATARFRLDATHRVAACVANGLNNRNGNNTCSTRWAIA